MGNAHALSESHTLHLSDGVLAPSSPPLSGSLSPHLLGDIHWIPSPTAQTLCHSQAPPYCVLQLTVNQPVSHGRILVQNAEMLNMCNERFEKATLINCGLLLEHDIHLSIRRSDDI